MKLYAICLVKNEDDVIAQTLTHACQYCDKIFVIDNGSTDRTWDIVQELAKSRPAIVAFARKLQPYDEGLRWLVYDAHHRELTDEDWWFILDGDELLAEDPRPVIEQAMKERADVIKAWQIQFYFTEKDYERWRAGRDDPSRPIMERRRYYCIDCQEPRLFRNQTERNAIFRQSKLLTPTTPLGTSVLRSKGKVCRRRILNRHYQYRDPVQIEKRLQLRYGNPSFAAQVKSRDWKSVLRASRGLHYYEDGARWRFSVSGLVRYYRGWVRYVFISRLDHVKSWLGRRMRFRRRQTTLARGRRTGRERQVGR